MAAPRDALASPYDVYDAGARATAMGGAQTAHADGAEALAYNPSQLATATQGLTFGTLATFGRARIVLKDRPEGYDVPDLGPPSRAVGDALVPRERVSSDLEVPLAGIYVGVVSKIIFEGLHGGVMVFLPLPSPISLAAPFADEREKMFSNQLRFERLGEPSHRLDVQFGLGYQVTEWLSVGVGATYLPSIGVNTGIYLADSTDQANAELAADVTTNNAFGLLAGLTVKLPGDVAVGVAFRDSLAMRLTSDNEIQINGVTGGEPIVQQARWTPVYTPARGSLGVAWTAGEWLFSGDLRYTFWSTYENGQGERANFNNVFSGALGTQWQYNEHTALRLGLGWEPSPVPDQTGRTNYVDNDRLSVSLGAGHSFQVGEAKFDVAWALRLQGLVRREVNKARLDHYPSCAPGVTELCDEVPDDLIDPSTDRPFPEGRGLQTGNPGFPGWVSGGWLGSLGVELRY